MNCRVCGTEGKDKPQIFMNEEWCSDNHRKVVVGEVDPTPLQWTTMDGGLMNKLIAMGKEIPA